MITCSDMSFASSCLYKFILEGCIYMFSVQVNLEEKILIYVVYRQPGTSSYQDMNRETSHLSNSTNRNSSFETVQWPEQCFAF